MVLLYKAFWLVTDLDFHFVWLFFHPDPIYLPLMKSCIKGEVFFGLQKQILRTFVNVSTVSSVRVPNPIALPLELLCNGKAKWSKIGTSWQYALHKAKNDLASVMLHWVISLELHRVNGQPILIFQLVLSAKRISFVDELNHFKT